MRGGGHREISGPPGEWSLATQDLIVPRACRGILAANGRFCADRARRPRLAQRHSEQPAVGVENGEVDDDRAHERE